jgi:hypothetical protein
MLNDVCLASIYSSTDADDGQPFVDLPWIRPQIDLCSELPGSTTPQKPTHML